MKEETTKTSGKGTECTSEQVENQWKTTTNNPTGIVNSINRTTVSGLTEIQSEMQQQHICRETPAITRKKKHSLLKLGSATPQLTKGEVETTEDTPQKDWALPLAGTEAMDNVPPKESKEEAVKTQDSSRIPTTLPTPLSEPASVYYEMKSQEVYMMQDDNADDDEEEEETSQVNRNTQHASGPIETTKQPYSTLCFDEQSKKKKALAKLNKIKKHQLPPIPIEFIDPITRRLMYDPVVTELGMTYERKSIEKWLMTSKIDPNSATPLKSVLLVPNNAIKSQICSFLEQYPAYKKEQYRPSVDQHELELIFSEKNMHKLSQVSRPNFLRLFGDRSIFHLVARSAGSEEIIANVIRRFLFDDLDDEASSKTTKVTSELFELFEKEIHDDELCHRLVKLNSLWNMPAGDDRWSVLDEALFSNKFEIFNLIRQLSNALPNPTPTVLDRATLLSPAFAEKVQIQLHHACDRGDLDAVKFLLKKAHIWERTNDWHPIECAAAAGHLPIVKLLLESGEQVHQSSIKRFIGLSNAICVAARCGSIPVIQLLLDHDVSVMSTSQKYYFPLNQACFAGQYETVVFLIERGANVGMTVKRFSAISAAAEAGHLNIVKLLIRHGASIHPSKRIDICPLFSAAEQSQCEVVKYLIERGAEINYQYENGYSALHYVVQHNSEYIPLERRKEVIKLLVLNGASLDLRNNHGDTPIDIAIPPLKSFLRRLRAQQNRQPFVNLSKYESLSADLQSARKDIAMLVKTVQHQQVLINRLLGAASHHDARRSRPMHFALDSSLDQASHAKRLKSDSHVDHLQHPHPHPHHHNNTSSLDNMTSYLLSSQTSVLHRSSSSSTALLDVDSPLFFSASSASPPSPPPPSSHPRTSSSPHPSSSPIPPPPPAL